MLGLANPWGLLGLASIAVLILLTRLARRRRTSRVSSLLLWRRVPSRPIERQRVRPDLLFVLRLLLLVTLAAAVAEPYRTAPGARGHDLAVVLDVSASMQVREPAGARFALARRRLDSLLETLPDEAAVLLVTAADRPRVALRWSTDRTRLRERLDALAPLDTPTALAPAIRLAAGAAARRAAARVVVLTDLPPRAVDLGPAELAAIEWVAIGRRGDNLGITRLAVQAPPFAEPGDVRVEVMVHNFDDAARSATLRASLDDRPWERHLIALPARGQRRLTLGRPPGPGLLRLAIDGGDALPADDQAVAWIPSQPPLDLLLVTESDALAAGFGGLVAALPAGRLDVVNHAGWIERAGAGDAAGQVAVFDRLAPVETGAGRALYLAPPPGNPVCPSARAVEDAAAVDWDPAHPALAGLGSLEAVDAARAVQLLDPPWGDVVVTAASRRVAYPFLVAGTVGGARRACLAAELPARLTDSDAMPLVLLLLGTLRWLAEPATELPIAVATGTPVHAPAGLAPGDQPGLRIAGQPPIVLAERAGARRVPTGNGGERLVLANLLDHAESDVGRDGGGELAATADFAPADAAGARHDVSGWCGALALLLLAIEWLAWSRQA